MNYEKEADELIRMSGLCASNNVVTLSGQTDAFDTDPIADKLRQLLEKAEAGQIHAIAYAVCLQDGSTMTSWDGIYGTRHPMMTAISCLHHRYTEAILNED